METQYEGTGRLIYDSSGTTYINCKDCKKALYQCHYNGRCEKCHSKFETLDKNRNLVFST